MIATGAPFPLYPDLKGDPLDGGSLYFGVANQNPETVPITVYWDVDGTQPAAQPIRTLNGFAVRAGTPANIYVPSDYSLTVRDKRGRQVFYAPSSTAFGNFGLISRVVASGQTVVINVPATYSTIAAAMASIANWVIFGTVQIQVADGAYVPTAGVVFSHPNGENVQLLGNLGAPANCRFKPAAPTFDLFTVNGGRFGLIAGFLMDLPSKAPQASNFTAILAVNGGRIGEVKNCQINNWYYHIAAREGGSTIFAHDFTSSNAGDVAVWGYRGGVVTGYNAAVTGANDSANNLGYGFQAEYGGVVGFTTSSATTCFRGGFAALSNGTGRYYACTADTNIGSGFVAQAGGVIEANGSSSTNNTRYGIEYFGAGTCTGLSTNTGNTLGLNNGAMSIDQGALGARLVSDGDMRLDVSGANNWFFNSSGGVQFQVQHTAASATWVLATGGATGAFLRSVGVGATYDISVQGKSLGSVFLGNSGANYIRVNPAAAGSPAQIRAEGSDADIDFMFGGKGAGLPRFGGFTANADAPVTGYITIKDFGGTNRKLAVIA